MRRIVVSTVMAALLLQTLPVFAATGGRFGSGPVQASVTGMATGQNGQTLANMTVRLRDLATGLLAGTATSSVGGEFSFNGIAPGTYAVELVDSMGQIVGTSASVTVAPGSSITGVNVAGSSAAGQTAGDSQSGNPGSSHRKTALIVVSAAAAAGVAALIVTRHNASPSK